MRLPQLLAFLTLLGAFVHAPAWASKQFPSLEPMPAELLNKKPNELILASNMPDSISQGGLPICAGVAARNLYLQKQCRTENSDCKNLAPEKVPSVLSVAGIGIDDASFEKIQSQKIIQFDSGGDAYNSLAALNDLRRINSEACFNLEQFNKMHGNNNRHIVGLFANLKSKYFANRTKTEADICYDCIIQDLKTNFSVTSDVETIRNALKKNTYDEFLYDVILKNCKIKIKLLDITVKKWPESTPEYTYKSFISTLKDRLKENKPVLASFCLDKEYVPQSDCNGHSFVVFGYRKVCDQNGKNCKEYIKTQNSWVEDYNKYYSDGWLDAEHYYKYSKPRLLWIE